MAAMADGSNGDSITEISPIPREIRLPQRIFHRI
jgi:hypothetical protein